MNFTIRGQIKSGKNAMQVARSGRHYPLKAFVDWRGDVFLQLIAQGVAPHKLKNRSITALFTYYPGDLRRRDVPGMIDALFHVFEKFGLISDDAQFKNVSWITMPVNRENPRVEVSIEAKTEAV